MWSRVKLSVSIMFSWRVLLAPQKPASTLHSPLLTIVSCQRRGAKCYNKSGANSESTVTRVHIQEAKESLASQYALICHEVHCRARATRTSGRGCASHKTLAWATAWISQVLHFTPNPVSSIPTHPQVFNWISTRWKASPTAPSMTPSTPPHTKAIYYYIHTLTASSHRLNIKF